MPPAFGMSASRFSFQLLTLGLTVVFVLLWATCKLVEKKKRKSSL